MNHDRRRPEFLRLSCPALSQFDGRLSASGPPGGKGMKQDGRKGWGGDSSRLGRIENEIPEFRVVMRAKMPGTVLRMALAR